MTGHRTATDPIKKGKRSVGRTACKYRCPDDCAYNSALRKSTLRNVNFERTCFTPNSACRPLEEPPQLQTIFCRGAREPHAVRWVRRQALHPWSAPTPHHPCCCPQRLTSATTFPTSKPSRRRAPSTGTRTLKGAFPLPLRSLTNPYSTHIPIIFLRTAPHRSARPMQVVGYPLLAPGRLHARVHHGAWLRRDPQGRVQATRRQGGRAELQRHRESWCVPPPRARPTLVAVGDDAAVAVSQTAAGC